MPDLALTSNTISFAATGAKFGMALGPLGSALGAIGGALLGSLTSDKPKPPNPDRFASGITALACVRGGYGSPGCTPDVLGRFLSPMWARRYPESARKWQQFASTKRAPWSERWIQQQLGYQARRYQIPLAQGLQLGQRVLQSRPIGVGAPAGAALRW